MPISAINQARLACAAFAAIMPIVLHSGLLAAQGVEQPDFGRTIRPILANHCFACHGPDAAQRQAGLRLDDGSAVNVAADSGATAIVAGEPDASELIRRIDSSDPDVVMPPPEAKKPLTPSEREDLRAWVAAGARYDLHWAWSAPRRPVPPTPANTEGVRNPIDLFIRARLDQAGLPPSAEADRATLIRRLSLDLTGLPPMLAEVDAFLADDRDDAYERLVDRLLASPHYGEKMAQDWLDLARYGDTNGYQDDATRSLWPYRDYVINAFNRHLPFDQFTIENLAGDLLPGATREQRVASGFQRNHRYNEEGGADPDEFLVAYAVDRTNTLATVWLGVTFGCAQCHDHKYDPFTQRDYYRLYAFFNSLAGEIGVSKQPSPPILRLPTVEQESQLAALGAELSSLDRLLEADRPRVEAAFSEWLALVPGAPRGDVADEKIAQTLSKSPAERTAEDQAALREYFCSQVDEAHAALRRRRADCQNRLQECEARVPTTLVFEQMTPSRLAYILQRGDFQQPGEQVTPGIPAVFGALDTERPSDRLALARWLMSRENPLTARVLANRLWKQFFGHGLVRTVDDFGSQGEPPTHPELLDWLATELWATDWNLQAIQRLIVTSGTYRQSAVVQAETLRLDPANRLLARAPRCRLTAEEIRDSALAASGLLCRRLGGPSVFPYQPDGFYADKTNDWSWPQSGGEDLYRRTLYTFWRRTTPHPALQAFDAPTRENCCPERPRTNTPLQALVTLNDPTFVEAARALAGQSLAASSDDAERIVVLWRRVTARTPESAERAALATALERFRQHYAQREAEAGALIQVGASPASDAAPPAELAAWTALGNVVLNLDEAVTRP